MQKNVLIGFLLIFSLVILGSCNIYKEPCEGVSLIEPTTNLQ